VEVSELETKLRALLAGKDIQFAFVFGSSVRRGPDAARDIDLAVSTREPLSLMQRGALAIELEGSLGKTVDVVDVGEASTLLRWEVVRDGRVVAARDEDALRAFRVLAPLEYADLRPYLDREAEGLRRALLVP
jgi:predicted nucleotidyltransferase